MFMKCCAPNLVLNAGVYFFLGPTHTVDGKFLLVLSAVTIVLILVLLGIFSCFCCGLLTSYQNYLFQKIYSGKPSVSNGLNPDQDRRSGSKLFA